MRTNSQGAIQLKLVYNSDLFDPERMQEFLDQFHHLAEQIVADPHRPINSYSLVTPRFKGLLPNPSQALPEPNFDPIVVVFDRWAERGSGSSSDLLEKSELDLRPVEGHESRNRKQDAECRIEPW